MGYFGLDHVGQSDTASELMWAVVAAMAKELSKGLSEDGNEFNTDGVDNVALIFCDYIIPIKETHYVTDEKLVKVAKRVIKQLDARIKKITKQSGEWGGTNMGDAANRKYHLKAYTKMRDKLKKWLEDV